ncbi:Cell cycle checkpoint protein rad17 [Entomortierella chlamydospora]|nr:Cell cycle checkpoint protein rad17 [Entomortierella chlamydospora]
MPPKRTREKSPVTPARRVPSRDAKTRSAASTASMYKEAEAYLAWTDDELSDQISDPEDIISEVEDGSDDDDACQDSDTFDEPIQTRSGRAQKKSSKATTAASKKGKAASVKKAPVAEKGKGRTQKTTATSESGPKATSRKASSSSKVTPPPKVAPPAATTAKRKASNVRFVPLISSPASSSSSSTKAAISGSTSSSQSSRTKSNPKTIVPNEQEDQWTEKYAPTSMSDVAVHPRKIVEVREWLQIYTDPRNKQQDASGGAILVLSGPAGSGKTTVLKMLAQEMGLNVVEWINSVNENNIIQRAGMPGEDSWRSTSIDDEYIPVMRAFQEFFSRAQRFRPLATTRDAPQQSQSTGGSGLSSTGKRNIILIEDLPPISAFSSRKIFQDTISKFANSRNNTTSVLVIIVSDVFTKQSTELLFSNTNESRDPAMTIRTLLPSTVLDRIDSGGKDNPRIKQIKFNPIAPTIMKKALRKLIDAEFKTSSAHAPNAVELDQAIEIHEGDIRAVINSLQFLCYIPQKRRKRYREAEAELEKEQELLHDSENKTTLGQDSSLGIFHAVAKVLYNRRDWSAPRVEFDKDVVKIPPQSWSRQRPPLQFNPEKELIEKLPIEPDLYTLMLHQNYTRHMNTIDECQTAIEYLCIADQFSHSSGGSNVGYTQMIQMQPYMTSLSVRGLLYAPTSQGPSTGGGGQRKHWWPELFAINRTMRANDQMFAEVTADLAGEEAHGLAAGHVTGPGFIPKRVIREEFVPMLHKCVTMNPYLSLFDKLLRPSSKTFVKTAAGNYGRKIGIVKKEFGEGDDGFLEEIVTSLPSDRVGAGPGVVDEIVDDSISSAVGIRGDSRFRQQHYQQHHYQQPKQQQHKPQFNSYTFQITQDEDPIEDFSD